MTYYDKKLLNRPRLKYKNGVPICDNCHKIIPTREQLMIDVKTNEDYFLCLTCHFFKYGNKENEATINKNLNRQPTGPQPSYDEYWKMKGPERFKAIDIITKIDTLKLIIKNDVKHRSEKAKRRIRKLGR